MKTLFPLTIFLTIFPLTIFGTILFVCWMMWLGARAAAVLPQAMGRATGGGRASQLSRNTAARQKLCCHYYDKTLLLEVKTKHLSHLYYLLLLLHDSEWLLIRLVAMNWLQ